MITIDYKDRRPIYEQIVSSIEDLAVRGVLEPDSQLPSVRQLAVELSINPNTIQRAYEALEQEGYLRAEAGRGVFAARGREDDGGRRTALLRQLDEAVTELVFLGMTPGELAERVTAAGRKGGERT